MSEPPKPVQSSDPDPQDKKLNISESSATIESVKPVKAIKPPKPEDKPFENFIKEEFIPALETSLKKRGVLAESIKLIKEQRPVVGGECPMVFGEISNGRRFWLSFNDEKITSLKNICLAERGSEPSLLESFLIDEKKTTLALLISRLLQRLNGQKWLDPN